MFSWLTRNRSVHDKAVAAANEELKRSFKHDFLFEPPHPTPDADTLRAQIEEAARKAEAELLPTFPTTLQRYQEAHDHAVRNYSFTCERIGDFLIVVVSRGTIFFRRREDGTFERYTGSNKSEQTAINLSRVKRVTYLAGHPPDNNGVIFYAGRSIDSIDERPTRIHWPYGCIFSNSDDVTKSQSYAGFHHRYNAEHVTRNTPRSAVDDRIFFDGLDLYLHAPATIGVGVLTKIHAELAKGSNPNVKVYEPPTAAKKNG